MNSTALEKLLIGPHDLVCRKCDTPVEADGLGARCPEDGSVLVPRGMASRFADDEVLGTVIAEKYAAVGVLGAGGFGTVYMAVQEPVGRLVAVKLIRANRENRADIQARFFREAKVVARLESSNTVTLYDYGEERSGALYMVFEMVRGRPLDKVLATGPLPPHRGVAVLLQMLRALSEAHHLGMVHRDVKPANIMVSPDTFDGESVKVLDFGIAKMLEVSPGQESSIETREGVVLGTPAFMAPEQARCKPIDARTDLYAVGAVAYSILTGRPPFERESAVGVLMAHCNDEPDPFPADSPVSAALQAVVMRALSKDPAARFQSAESMMAALQMAFPGVGQSSLGLPGAMRSGEGARLDQSGASMGFDKTVVSDIRSDPRIDLALYSDSSLRGAAGEAIGMTPTGSVVGAGSAEMTQGWVWALRWPVALIFASLFVAAALFWGLTEESGLAGSAGPPVIHAATLSAGRSDAGRGVAAVSDPPDAIRPAPVVMSAVPDAAPPEPDAAPPAAAAAFDAKPEPEKPVAVTRRRPARRAARTRRLTRKTLPPARREATAANPVVPTPPPTHIEVPEF